MVFKKKEGMFRLVNVGLFLVMMEGLTAFVLPSNNAHSKSQVLGRMSGRSIQLRSGVDQQTSRRTLPKPVKMQHQDSASVINSIKVWSGAPKFIKESKIVCSPTNSDASGTSTAARLRALDVLGLS